MMSNGFTLGLDGIRDADSFIFDLIRAANPNLEDRVLNKCRLSNLRANYPAQATYAFDTLIDVTLSDITITFNYNRFNLAEYAYEETGTVGYIDVPVFFIEEIEESIKERFWNLLSGVTLIEENENSKVWRCDLGENNRVLEFYFQNGDERVYQDHFLLYTTSNAEPKLMITSKYEVFSK